MHNFNHLKQQPNASNNQRAHPGRGRYASNAAGFDIKPDQSQQTPDRHGNAHWIAASQEAKNNPVLALKLIAKETPHLDAIRTLAISPRHLSDFTKRKMIKVFPGWECLDTEDRNLASFMYGITHEDTNGYQAGFTGALRVLEKYIEPWNIEDMITPI
ncbi:hypothetical protein [Acerihabitans sp.]|uniref:hypothetical protein n=1 Tax=Acerihabitans sp. TaxID=2811394 RepID=UPI002ED9B1C9